MGGRTNLRTALLELVKGEQEPPIIGKVLAVNNHLIDVQPENTDDADVLEVRLVASPEIERFIIIPKVNSFVIISPLNKDEWFISMFSDIDTIELKGNEFGGLIKIEDLVDKINRLEDAHNDFVNTFITHVHPSTGAPPSPPFPTPIAPLTTRGDMENTDIQHGG